MRLRGTVREGARKATNPNQEDAHTLTASEAQSAGLRLPGAMGRRLTSEVPTDRNGRTFEQRHSD
jgi:hypothetical protein